MRNLVMSPQSTAKLADRVSNRLAGRAPLHGNGRRDGETSGRVIAKISAAGASGGYYQAAEQIWDDSAGAWIALTGGRDFTTSGIGELYELAGTAGIAANTIVEAYAVGGDESGVQWVFAVGGSAGNLTYSGTTLSLATADTSGNVGTASVPVGSSNWSIWVGPGNVLVVQAAASPKPVSLAQAVRIGFITTDGSGNLIALHDDTGFNYVEPWFGLSVEFDVNSPELGGTTYHLVFQQGRLISKT